MFEGLFQPMHLLLIFFSALLLFGPKLLALGKGAGESIRALKRDRTSGNGAVYPRTLASLFGSEGD
jgi:Sec-independent protein translocase protein TatA